MRLNRALGCVGMMALVTLGVADAFASSGNHGHRKSGDCDGIFVVTSSLLAVSALGGVVGAAGSCAPERLDDERKR